LDNNVQDNSIVSNKENFQLKLKKQDVDRKAALLALGRQSYLDED